MTRSPFEEVSPGQPWEPPYSGEWNSMLAVAARNQSTALSAGEGEGRALTGATTVLVNNTTGSTYAAGAIVVVGQPSFTTASDSYESYIFDSAIPVAADRGRWGIVPYPIPSGELGIAISGGIAYCQVNVTHESHSRADVVAGGGLESGFSGSAEITHKPSGTGTLDCVVRFHVLDQAEVKGVVDADIAVDGSGVVSVWRGSDTGSNITAHLNWMHGNEKVSAGKQVIASWFSDEMKWIITHAECEN